jgi:hypothetical protein
MLRTADIDDLSVRCRKQGNKVKPSNYGALVWDANVRPCYLAPQAALPACEMVLDIIGDLFAHGRQLKHLVFDDRVVSLLGELPILGCFVAEIVSPFHVV